MDSKLDKQNEQLALQMEMPWISEALEIMSDHAMKHNPEFTGEKVFKGDPERYGRIVAMRFRMGATVRQIAKIEKCSPQTVTAIIRREQGSKTVEEYRKEMSEELTAVVSATMDSIMEDLQDRTKMRKTPMRDKAFLVDKLLEKRELLSGGATHRGETMPSEEEQKDKAMKHAKDAQELQGELVDFDMVEEKGGADGTQEA